MPNATAPRIRAGEAYIRITADNSALIRGLDAARDALRSFGQALKGIGADMMQLSGAIALPLAMSAKAFADYDDKVRILAAITGAASNETESLSKYMRDLGATTAFTAEQVAQGGVELARMGFNVMEVKDGLKPIMDLVRATGTETFRLGEVASYASATMRGFGLSSEKFAYVCDIMGVAADNSAMDIADLGEAMKIVAPSAKTINEDIKDTAASLMLMANAGVRGSLAGTSLRKVYQSLAAQSGKTAGLSPEQIQEGIRGAAELSGMGISLVDDKGNLRKTNEIMSEIAKKARALKTGEKINFATDIFDLRGSLGALSIMDKAASLDWFKKKLDEAAGHNDRVAKEQEQSIGGAIRLIVSQFKEMQISIGEALWKTFGKETRDQIVKFISVIRNLIVENKKLASQIVVGIGAVFAFGVALFGLGAAIKILSSAFGILSFAIKALTGVLMLGINAYILLKNVVLATTAALKAFSLWVAAGASISGYTLAIVSLNGAFVVLAHYLHLLPGMIRTLKDTFASVAPVVIDAFKSIRDSLASGDMQGALKVFVASMKLAALKAILPLRQVWVSIAPTWKNIWADMVAWIKKGLISVISFSQKFGNNIVYGVVTLFEKLWNGLFTLIVRGLSGASKFIVDSLIGLWYTIAEIASYIPGLEDWGESQMQKAEYGYHKTNQTIDNTADSILERGTFDVDRVVRKWDEENARIDAEDAKIKAAIDEETNEKKRLNNEALDAEFVALTEQINAAEKGAAEAKEFAAQFHVMKQRVSELKDYFENVVETVVLSDTLQGKVSQYESALQSGDSMVRDQAEAELRQAIEQEREKARNLEMEFNEKLEAAQSDRVIDRAEYGGLVSIANARAESRKLKEEYERLLAAGYSDASEAVMDSTSKNKGIGAWSSDVLNAILSSPDEKRTADAAESINDNLQDIKRKIFSGKWGRLTYGA